MCPMIDMTNDLSLKYLCKCYDPVGPIWGMGFKLGKFNMR